MNDIVAFAGTRRIASGEFTHVVRKAKRHLDETRDQNDAVLMFDAVSSKTIEVDFRGPIDDVIKRCKEKSPESALERKPVGRPRLGVVPREVTLLPRHWDWLNAQPGGASVALRRLVEEARKSSIPSDRKREAQESAYRFMTVMAGNLPGYEEALRALFSGSPESFKSSVKEWPAHVREHVLELAGRALP